jgi:ATP-dependent DNA ligase
VTEFVKWRFPDKPNRISRDYLLKLDQKGGYIATVKYDGWRCVTVWDGNEPEFYSRREMALGGPTKHPVSKTLRTETKEFFVQNNLPAGTRLDSEWMARRHEGDEHLVVFGILFLGPTWMGPKMEKERWAIVSAWKPTANIHIAEATTEKYVEFFDKHSKDLRAEGIVLKHELSRLEGSSTASKDNPLWLKCKWRDGPDGHSVTF